LSKPAASCVAGPLLLNSDGRAHVVDHDRLVGEAELRVVLQLAESDDVVLDERLDFLRICERR
jgi:hypothetical protein